MFDFTLIQKYYIACGYTDMRKQIDGLVAVVELQFGQKLDETSIFQWPRNEQELKLLTKQEFRWLMEGLSIVQKKAFEPGKPGSVC